MPLPTPLLKQTEELAYLAPDGDLTNPLISKEIGGVAISDGSSGLLVKNWIVSWDANTGNFIAYPENESGNQTIIFNDTNVTELSASFDANMRPAVAYVKSGTCRFRFYDTITQNYITIILPAGSRDPKVCHDDKRSIAVLGNESDVCLFYLRGFNVFYRVQRERYETENQVATLSIDTARLNRVGMTSGLRVQLELEGGSNILISSP
jgi:hypothetical protein